MEKEEGAGSKKMDFGKKILEEKGGAAPYFYIYNIFFYMTLGY